jgi:serine/threonine protein kinase
MTDGDVTQQGHGRDDGAAPVRQTGPEGFAGTIGPYRGLSRLGSGGMGVVYRGVDPAGRDVAVKVLKPEIAGDPTARRRLAREVDMMRRVRSPHVADVLDGDVTADHPYVVTRFVPGRPLDEVVALGGPLRGGALRLLALGLAKALRAIHQAGVVHRDLKPSNVMLVDDEPVVIDFGIAQAFDSTRLTQTGMVTGTPGYLAPEIFDEERATSASDVHAWAATVAFAATGRPPFGQGSLEVVFFNIINGRAQLAGVPEPLLGVVRSALAREPGRRPSAAELVQEIAALEMEPDTGSGQVTTPDLPDPAHGGHETAPARDAVRTPATETLRGDAPLTDGSWTGGTRPDPAGTDGPRADPSPSEAPGADAPRTDAPHTVVPPWPDPAWAGAPRTVPPRTSEAHRRGGELVVAPAWSRLFSYLAVATMVGIAIMMPVVGLALALAGAFVLHAGDAAAGRPADGTGAVRLLTQPLSRPATLVRGVAITALTVPYAGVCAVVVTLGLVSLVVAGLQPDVLGACAWGVGASVYVLWAGPGVRGPRRQLARIFGAAAPEPRGIALMSVVLGTLACAAVVGAVSLMPSFEPVDRLDYMLAKPLDRLQQALSAGAVR